MQNNYKYELMYERKSWIVEYHKFNNDKLPKVKAYLRLLKSIDESREKNEVTLVAYRGEGRSPMRHLGGKFYSLEPFGGEKYIIHFKNLFQVPYEEAYPFEGHPSESLYPLYKTRLIEYRLMFKGVLEDQHWLDILAAEWAKSRGYDGIMYGDFELQNLQEFDFEKSLKRIYNYQQALKRSMKALKEEYEYND